jgi:hypothetical protein
MTECVVKPLCVVKFISSKPTGIKNPTMLRVGVARAEFDPRVILTDYMPLSCSFSSHGLIPQPTGPEKLT